jgi:hypothetical protein
MDAAAMTAVRPTRRLRRLLAALALVGAGLGLAACSSGGGTSSTTTTVPGY